MNTNTVEQAERLKELGVEQDEFYSFVWVEYDGRKQVAEWRQTFNCNGYKTHELRLSNSDKIIHLTCELIPALTLDELHAVFEALYDLDDEFDLPALDAMQNEIKKLWFLDPFGKTFPRTKNHAADWTSILIWLLENKYIMVEQVNLALEGE